MNNIIQKGGLSPKELTIKLLEQKRYDGKKFSPYNENALQTFYNEMIKGKTLDTIRPSDKIFSGSMLEKKNENAFFLGFNAAFEYLFIKLQKKMNLDTPLVLVDGVNIIRNINILIGFFPLIMKKLPDYVDNVILLIYDTFLKNNNLVDRPAEPGVINFYVNLKIVLENVLPVILENLRMPFGYFNMIVLQHDSANFLNGEKAISNSTVSLESPTKNIYFIKIAKVLEDGMSKELPVLPSIHTSSGIINKIEHPARIWAPAGLKKNQNVHKSTPHPTKKAEFHYQPFEADDVAIVCLAYFYDRFFKHPNLYILSGDNFRWFESRVSIQRRARLYYDNKKPDDIFITQIEPVKEFYSNLDKKIFNLPTARWEEIKKVFNNEAKNKPILPIAGISIIDIWSRIDTYINTLIKKKTPFSADSSDDEETVKKMKNKYIKYKSKYLLLKSQYN